MTISELVRELERVRAEHGDVAVMVETGDEMFELRSGAVLTLAMESFDSEGGIRAAGTCVLDLT